MTNKTETVCERATRLRQIYEEVITGGKVLEHDFDMGNGVRRRIKFSPSNIAALKKEIAEAETACAKSQGKAGRRFAIMPR